MMINDRKCIFNFFKIRYTAPKQKNYERTRIRIVRRVINFPGANRLSFHMFKQNSKIRGTIDVSTV